MDRQADELLGGSACSQRFHAGEQLLGGFNHTSQCQTRHSWTNPAIRHEESTAPSNLGRGLPGKGLPFYPMNPKVGAVKFARFGKMDGKSAGATPNQPAMVAAY
jgi:hypothetical protein